MAEIAGFLICPLPCFLSPEGQTIALKFASKLIIHLLQTHQQVREMDLINSFVILEVLVIEAVVWLLLDPSPKLVFFCVLESFLILCLPL